MPQHLTRLRLYLGASALSLLLSVYLIALNPVLSNDSVLYLRAAQAFHESGLDAALALYPWPTLSILIAWTHSLTGLSFELSAYLLSICSYLLLLSVFITIIRELGGSSGTQLLAVFLMLVFPTLNDYREYIIRDHAYWLFILLSLLQLLRFERSGIWWHAFGWALAAIAATTFRTEGLFILTLTPLALLRNRRSTMLFAVAKPYAVVFGVALLVAIPLLLSPDTVSDTRLYREIASLPQFLSQIGRQLDQSVTAIKLAVDNYYFSHDAKIVFIGGLLVLLVYQGLHALTPVYLLLLLWARGCMPDSLRQGNAIIAGYAMAISLYLVLFILDKQFINDRFMMPLCLVALIYLPFAVTALADGSNGRLWSPRSVLLMVLLAYPTLDTLISTGTDKRYIAEAVHWLQQQRPDHGVILTNNQHIAYFSGGSFDACGLNASPGRVLNRKKCKAPELLVYEVKRENKRLNAELQQLQQNSGYSLQARIQNNDQDAVVILARSGG